MEELNSTEIEELKQNTNLSNYIFHQFSENNGMIKNNRIYLNYVTGILNSNFYLIKKIGSGASGSVYLAYSIYDKNIPKSLYAIKILNETEQNDSLIKNCEKKLLEEVNHKNILKTYSFGKGILQTSSGLLMEVFYIVMDYLNHGSLLSQIKDNIGFGEDFGRLIFAQLLDGLEAIHNSGVVHLDIKLENIMLSGDDYTLKYIDFGFSKQNSYDLSSYLGTPNYAAPELHLRRSYLGVYADIFSLGVTLFIIVTGYLPFILPKPDDPLYCYIYDIDYISYWKKRKIKVSPSFMELFDNLIAFDPIQRPSISEIKNSKWMKEMNLELLPLLKQEFMKREEIYKIKLMLGKEKITKISIENIINNDMKNNILINKVDKVLLKLREEKKIDAIKYFKERIFQNYDRCYQNTEESDRINKLTETNSKQGSIRLKSKKQANTIMKLLKPFLRKEGFTLINKNLESLSMELTNGEIDVIFSFKKTFKFVKIFFTVENGDKVDFFNFKKIMRKFARKKK